MNSSVSAHRSAALRRSPPEVGTGRGTRACVRWSRSRRRRSPATRQRRAQGLWTRRTTGGSASIRTLRLNAPPMSAHPAPRATRAISAETAGSSGLALDPNQRGKAGREVGASLPVTATAHQRTRGGPCRRAWRDLAVTPLVPAGLKAEQLRIEPARPQELVVRAVLGDATFMARESGLPGGWSGCAGLASPPALHHAGHPAILL